MKINKKNISKKLIKIGVDPSDFNLHQLMNGMRVELEHGNINPLTNITNDNFVMTLKIALAHMMENKNYYKILAKSKL